MSFSHTWEAQGVIIKISGSTTGREIDEANSHVRHSPRLGELQYVIADYADVDSVTVSDYQALLIAAKDYWAIRANPELKVALVGTHPEMKYLFSLYAESPMVKGAFALRSFADVDEARAWLGDLATPAV